MGLITRGLSAKTLITRGLGFLLKFIPTKLHDPYYLMELYLDFSTHEVPLEYELSAVVEDIEFVLKSLLFDFTIDRHNLDFNLFEPYDFYSLIELPVDYTLVKSTFDFELVDPKDFISMLEVPLNFSLYPVEIEFELKEVD